MPLVATVGVPRRSTARGSATVAVWTLVSRLTGVGRVVVVGSVLGPTFFANVFLSANTVPQIVFAAIAGTVLPSVVVPAVLRASTARGPRSAEEVVGRAAGFLLVSSAVLVVVLACAAPLLAWTLTLGVPDAEQARARKLATLTLLLVVPQVMLYATAALGAAVQQARDRFALAAAAPCVENLGLVATMIAAGLLYRPGIEVGEAPLGLVVLLGLGATGSVALHMGLQVFGASRAGVRIRPRGGWRADAVTRELVRRLRASVAVGAGPSASLYTILAVAATMPGGVLVLQIAHQVYSASIALGPKAVSTAALPALSGAASVDDARFAVSWRQALSYVVLVALPPLLLLAAFAMPIAETLAHGELGDRGPVVALAACISVLAVALLPASLHDLGRQALFARLDVRGPQRAAAAQFGVVAALGSLAATYPAGPLRLAGIAAAVLAAETVAAGLVLRRLRRAVRPERIVDGRRLVTAGLAALTMVPVLGSGWVLVGSTGNEPQVDVPIAMALGVLAVALFTLSASSLSASSRAGRVPGARPAQRRAPTTSATSSW